MTRLCLTLALFAAGFGPAPASAESAAAAPDAAVPDSTAPDSAVPDSAVPDSAASAPPEIYRPRWVFAVEDTMDLPAFFESTPIQVRADRLRIGDIVRRCIEREEELRARIETYEATVLSKMVGWIGDEEDPKKQFVIEEVEKVFFRKPDESRSVTLKHEHYRVEDGERKEWDEEDASVGITYRDFNELPFYLEKSDEYHFEILTRDIVGDRVIYAVRLTPRSDFAIAPEGTIWVDCSNFSILREEFDFGDRVPMPLFVKRAGPVVRERERIGDLWVWRRMLIRVDLRNVGVFRLLDGSIPDGVQLAVEFRDHRVNEGWSTDPGEGDPPPERRVKPRPN